MKIVVSGGWSYGNIGDEAIAAATIYLVDKYFPRAQVVYTAYEPSDFLENHGIRAENSLHRDLCALSREQLEQLPEQPQAPVLDRFRSLVQDAELFIMSGGGYFQQGSPAQFYTRLMEIRLAAQAGARVALVGQSIGPVFPGRGHALMKQALELCSYVCVRDESSLALLRSLGAATPIHMAPDLAMVIHEAYPRTVRRDARIVNIMPAAYSAYVSNAVTRPRNKTVERIRKRFSPGGINYRVQMTRLMRALARDPEVELHVVMSTTWRWDRKFVEQITAGIPADRITVHECRTGRELCQALSRGGAVISTKMHPLIISTAYGIPAIGICYNYKVSDFLEMIGAEDACYPIDKVHGGKMYRQLCALRGGSVDARVFAQQVHEGFRGLVQAVEADA